MKTTYDFSIDGGVCVTVEHYHLKATRLFYLKDYDGIVSDMIGATYNWCDTLARAYDGDGVL